MQPRKIPVTVGGVTAETREDVERIWGIKYTTYKGRMNRLGWSAEKALLTPLKKKGVSGIGDTTTTEQGYLLEKITPEEARMYPSLPNGRPDKDGNRWAYQHRVVWCRHFGRDLLPEENLHHINGDRADNRIENLELWSSSQPSGQRVEDKVNWAREILATYADDFPE